MRARWVISAFPVLLLLFGACQGESEPEPELKDYACQACGEYQAIVEQRDASAEAAGCTARSAVPNGGVTCTVDNIHYHQLLISFEGCESEPPCPEGDGEPDGEGGNSGTFGWDYECHICGDESDVDSAWDGGSEGAKCSDSGKLGEIGERCPDGALATVLGFNDCEGVPACAAE